MLKFLSLLLHPCTSKVIIQKSRREVSPLGQYTIDCKYLAYFEAKKKIKKIFLQRDIMQLFSADATGHVFKLSSKVAHNRTKFFFQYSQPAQNQPKSHFLFHKNVSLRDFYIMTLITCTHPVSLATLASSRVCSDAANCFRLNLLLRTSKFSCLIFMSANVVVVVKRSQFFVCLYWGQNT